MFIFCLQTIRRLLHVNSAANENVSIIVVKCPQVSLIAGNLNRTIWTSTKCTILSKEYRYFGIKRLKRCLEIIGASTSHNFIGLHGMLQGQLYLSHVSVIYGRLKGPIQNFWINVLVTENYVLESNAAILFRIWNAPRLNIAERSSILRFEVFLLSLQGRWCHRVLHGSTSMVLLPLGAMKLEKCLWILMESWITQTRP
jgi:hypothetical protein